MCGNPKTYYSFFPADEEFYIMKLFRLKIMVPINFTERSETLLPEYN